MDTIVQQLEWYICSSVVGTIVQQSLARLFYSQPCLFYRLDCLTVSFPVEELCHVPGIRHMIRILPEAAL